MAQDPGVATASPTRQHRVGASKGIEGCTLSAWLDVQSWDQPNRACEGHSSWRLDFGGGNAPSLRWAHGPAASSCASRVAPPERRNKWIGVFESQNVDVLAYLTCRQGRFRGRYWPCFSRRNRRKEEMRQIDKTKPEQKPKNVPTGCVDGGDYILCTPQTWNWRSDPPARVGPATRSRIDRQGEWIGDANHQMPSL